MKKISLILWHNNEACPVASLNCGFKLTVLESRKQFRLAESAQRTNPFRLVPFPLKCDARTRRSAEISMYPETSIEEDIAHRRCVYLKESPGNHYRKTRFRLLRNALRGDFGIAYLGLVAIDENQNYSTIGACVLFVPRPFVMPHWPYALPRLYPGK